MLLTGKHMGRTVVRGNSTAPIVIQPGQLTLASLLKQAGYHTACIGKWGVGTPDNFTNPNEVGFDHFFGYVNMWHAHNFYPEFLIRNGEVVQLVSTSSQVKVAARGKALSDGAAGHTVRVRNLSSGRVVEGRVIGLGKVAVQ